MNKLVLGLLLVTVSCLAQSGPEPNFWRLGPDGAITPRNGRNVAIGATVSAGTLQQGTYFVDCAGSDANNGKSPAAPFATIAKVNTLSLNPGESVMFRRGCTWRESLAQASAGTASAPITFGSYGSGRLPVISGADVIPSWTSESVTTPTFLSGGSAPQAWWMFEEASGSVANDGSANGNTLTVNGGVYARSASAKEGAKSADTASSRYYTLAIASLSSNFPFKGASSDTTIGGWVYFSATPSAYGSIAGLTNNSSCGFAITLDSTGTSFFSKVYNNAGANRSNDAQGPTLTTGRWYHVVQRTTAGTGEIALFVDGVKYAPSFWNLSGTIGACTSGVSLQIGNQAGLYDEWFAFSSAVSDLDIWRIYTFGLAGKTYTSYYAAHANDFSQAFEADMRLQLMSLKTDLVPRSYWYDSGASRLYVRPDADTNPALETWEVSTRDYPVFVAGAYQTYQDLSAAKAKLYNIKSTTLASVSGSLVTRSILRDAFVDNLRFDAMTPYSGLTITDSEISGAGASGIQLNGASTGAVIRNNRVFGNSQLSNLVLGGVADHEYSAGIKTFGGTADYHSGLLIEHNEVYNNQPLPWVPLYGYKRGAGIWFDTVVIPTGPQAVIRKNFVHDNASVGVYLEKTRNASAYYNVLHNNASGTLAYYVGDLRMSGNSAEPLSYSYMHHNTVYTSGFAPLVLDSADNAGWSNNVIKANVLAQAAAGRRHLYVNVSLTPGGNLLDGNCYGNGAAFYADNNGSAVTSLTAWTAASGQDAKSVYLNPGFIGAAYRNFELMADSPCSGAGVPLGTPVGLTLR